MTEIDPENTPKKTPAKTVEATKVKPAFKPKAHKRLEPKGAKVERKGAGVPFIVMCSALAAAIGGAAGWYGPKHFDPANAAPAQAITQNAEQLKTLRAALDQQSQTIAALQKQNRQLSQLAQQGVALAPRLEQAETALSALEALQSEDIQRKAERLDLIESLVSSSDDPQAGAAALAKSLEDMQAQISALKLSAATAEPAVISYESAPNGSEQNSETDIESDESLSSNPNEAEANNAESEDVVVGGDSGDGANDIALVEDDADPEALYDFTANFPKEKMLAALRAQEQNTPKPSWLRRTLQKHVQSDDSPLVNARRVIDEAQALTNQGDILAAADKLQTLNPTLRAAAHMWLTEARKLR